MIHFWLSWKITTFANSYQDDFFLTDMAEKNDIGKIGEEAARSYLEINGYKILDANWRHRHYELDIVAEKDGMLVIVEVKTRSSGYLVEPERAINDKKIQRIVTAADAYTRKKNMDMPIRFDVIFVMKKAGAYTMDEHIEDAFFAPLS